MFDVSSSQQIVSSAIDITSSIAPLFVLMLSISFAIRFFSIFLSLPDKASPDADDFDWSALFASCRCLGLSFWLYCRAAVLLLRLFRRFVPLRSSHCPSCGASDNPPGSYYCVECGALLASSAGKSTVVLSNVSDQEDVNEWR